MFSWASNNSNNTPKKLREYPSIQAHISQPTIPPDSLINRQLQPIRVGVTKKQTQQLALGSTFNPAILYNGSKYSDFQLSATLGMDSKTLSNRNHTVSQALGGFNIHEQETTVYDYQESNYTRDRVSYKKEYLEGYDFCAEIHDTALPPYKGECLQKEFLREGGQSGGALYPNEETIRYWNSHPSWLHVKSAIKRLSSETDSANKAVQQKAIINFHGIILDKKQPIFKGDPGLEVFWFTHSNDLTAPTTFLGRRIRTTIPFINRQLINDDGCQIKKDQFSIIYFTNLIIDDYAKELPVRIRVTADDGFSTHFNSNMSGFTNAKRVNSSRELTSLTYMSPTTFTMNEDWILKANERNQLSGYYHQGIGGFYYKLELWNGETWNQIPEKMLRLTCDPFAPMFSFEVEQTPSKHGCDFPFCDRRFGGHKMKWVNDQGGGPNWDYSITPNEEFPFGKSAMIFSPGGGGITSRFSLKLYSFMTMTLLIRLRTVPAIENDILIFYSPIGRISIHLTPVSHKSVSVGLATSNNGNSENNPVINVGHPYLIIVRMLRNEYDIHSLNSIQIAAEHLRVIGSLDSIKESKPIHFKNPLTLENPNSTNAYTIHLGGQTDMILYWIHLFDYHLKPEHIRKEALQTW